uniref:hypothetical protein n=1 Tax=Candidatus Cryptobacteroides bacterium TaxID=3085639 RepID=UPI004024EB1F
MYIAQKFLVNILISHDIMKNRGGLGPKLPKQRHYCPLSNFTYRHKFANFVSTSFGQRTTLQI